MQVLLIGTDPGESRILAKRLAPAGFVALHADSPEQAVRNGFNQRAVAVIVALGLGASNAATIVRSLREAGMDQPLIVLAARGGWREKIECLDCGADDYLLKPVHSEEIAARLRAIIRRSAGSATDRISVGGIDLDLKTRCAWLEGKCLNLTRNEFRLLRLFMLLPGRNLKHSEIQDQLHPGMADRSINALEVQIARLRRKVGRQRILTVRGIGYRFGPEVSFSRLPGVTIEPCKRASNSICIQPERWVDRVPQEHPCEACTVHLPH
ncbi:MAG: winged helix-turn-helix domain-containing protein [Sphingomonadales bacterium]